jgi:hypothetical protein
MSTFEDRNKGLGGHGESAIEVERDVVIVESENTVSRSQRNPFAVLPILLGVIFLVTNIFVMTRFTSWFFAPQSTPGTISLVMMLVSIAICLVLIIYGLAQRRADADLAGHTHRGGSWYFRAVGAPILLGLLAPLVTLWALQVNKLAGERWEGSIGKPCIEVYQQAASIAKDNPQFRMPATDPYEVRCTVNAVLGR